MSTDWCTAARNGEKIFAKACDQARKAAALVKVVSKKVSVTGSLIRALHRPAMNLSIRVLLLLLLAPKLGAAELL